MKKSIAALILPFAAASVLAACNSNNGLGTVVGPTAGPPSGNCGGPPNQLEVLNPIPGTRQAPSSQNNIYVSTSGALPPNNQFDFFLSQSNGNSTFTGPFAPISLSQIPTPRATPSYPNPTYYASAIAGPYGSSYIIGPRQAVSLLWNDGGRNCVPHFVVSNFRTK
ncbi:MAG: hypothetical protein WA431_04905 [Candidatus Cybelea sp.]